MLSHLKMFKAVICCHLLKYNWIKKYNNKNKLEILVMQLNYIKELYIILTV